MRNRKENRLKHNIVIFALGVILVGLVAGLIDRDNQDSRLKRVVSLVNSNLVVPVRKLIYGGPSVAPDKERAEIKRVLPVADFNTENYRAFSPLIAKAAFNEALDPDLIRAIIIVESKFDPMAMSPQGRKGLMQLAPAIAQETGVQDPLNPKENIDGGAKHLRHLLDKFNQDPQKAVAAYSAGVQAVVTSRGIPADPETRRYVDTVFKIYRLIQNKEKQTAK